jgi:hypothetical protein
MMSCHGALLLMGLPSRLPKPLPPSHCYMKDLLWSIARCSAALSFGVHEQQRGSWTSSCCRLC